MKDARVTRALITVDTELSALLQQRGARAADNFALSITGRTSKGDFGIGWQMDQLEAHGLHGVYFVDPMPALVHGEALLADIVQPIVERGHDVQVHIHTEWLEWAKSAPVAARGRNIGDFDLADQITLIGWARDALVRAGAPEPTAFRAGNYGANDVTLAALAKLGLIWDASFNACYTHMGCNISAPTDTVNALALGKVIELPVALINDRRGSVRPAQICALSAAEMRAGLRHAAANAQPAFSIVTHSFEMLSRDRQRPNRMVMSRFKAMCREIADNPALASGGFAELAPQPGPNPGTIAPPSTLRTIWRMGEQAIATWVYERQLRPV